MQDERVGLVNEVQLLSYMARSERVVSCDHDHLQDSAQGLAGKVCWAELLPWPHSYS